MSSGSGTALRPLFVPLAAAAVLAVGCGGDSGMEDTGGSTDLTANGAEDTVRLYLAVVAAGEGEIACGLLADDFEAVLLEGEQAHRLGADTCPDFFAELEESHAQAGEPFAFEGHPIREPADAQALEFRTAVKQQLGEPSAISATVRGEEGATAFRLDAPSGEWRIAEIIEGG